MQTSWITSFQEWLLDNQNRLKQEEIRVEVVGITPYVPSSIHVDFYSERFQGTAELWEDGQSEFYFLDWAAADRDPEYQLEVTHHDFTQATQLHAALETLVSRMSPVLAVR